jgi:hypothetical protein
LPKWNLTNISNSIWKPGIAADGTLYFTNIARDGSKRLFSSKYHDGIYQTAQPLSFSDGKHMDVDPEIAPDSSFLIFCSAGHPSPHVQEQGLPNRAAPIDPPIHRTARRDRAPPAFALLDLVDGDQEQLGAAQAAADQKREHGAVAAMALCFR